jgi:hypothetical protein
MKKKIIGAVTKFSGKKQLVTPSVGIGAAAALMSLVAVGFYSPTLNARSSNDPELEKYFTITEVQTVEVGTGFKSFSDVIPIDSATDPVVALPAPTPVPSVPAPRPTSAQPLPPIPAPVFGDIDIGEIIKVGTEIWKIIEKNKPVVDTKFQQMSLLPQGAKNWDELENWSIPQSRLFKTTYLNGFKQKVIEFTYRVSYTTNGSFDGRGKYLSRVEIEPAELNVAWGYKLSAIGEVVNPHNAGTRLDPIAAMELRVNWTVDTSFKHSQASTRFYVRGDGLFKDLTNGNIL